QITGIDTMGGKEVNDLYFTDVRLPADSVVGEVGGGWQQLMTGLNTERLILAAMQLGVAQRAFDDCLRFVREREQFGRPVGSFQVIRHRMADLATEIEATRLLVYAVAAKVDDDPQALFPREASMAKLKATELSKRVTLECMQSMGGYGYATEYGMEHLVRQAVVSTVYGGTNEVQRDAIGKPYGLRAPPTPNWRSSVPWTWSPPAGSSHCGTASSPPASPTSPAAAGGAPASTPGTRCSPRSARCAGGARTSPIRARSIRSW